MTKTDKIITFIERYLLLLILFPIYYVLMFRLIANPPPKDITCGMPVLGHTIAYIFLSSVMTIVLVIRFFFKGYSFIEFLVVAGLIYIPVLIGFSVLN